MNGNSIGNVTTFRNIITLARRADSALQSYKGDVRQNSWQDAWKRFINAHVQAHSKALDLLAQKAKPEEVESKLKELESAVSDLKSLIKPAK